MVPRLSDRSCSHDVYYFTTLLQVAETLLLGLAWDLAVDLYGFFMWISKFLGIAHTSKKVKKA